MPIALITGSGFYDLPGLEQPKLQIVNTAFGSVTAQTGVWHGHDLVFLARHGDGHQALSHQVPFQALIQACSDLQVSTILGFSVVGVVNPDLPLGQLLLPCELYFPDNRLPNGQACTLFQTPGDPLRGHAITDSYFHSGLGEQWQKACQTAELPLCTGLTYGHVQGPRFNSKSEIRALAQLGVDIVSQTLGPEAVLAAEAEIPYAALTFGVDYANGVQSTPTPLTDLNQHLKRSKPQMIQALQALLQDYQKAQFEGFVYRFSSSQGK
ncbi:MAG: MTAP family purine nucleoside phosphorylase [Candidatus Sericytochromatia bacterium]|nr:MTAP family purine nucleoside phosphorylase [Candidatus Sericytochromatia bacterium]